MTKSIKNGLAAGILAVMTVLLFKQLDVSFTGFQIVVIYLLLNITTILDDMNRD